MKINNKTMTTQPWNKQQNHDKTTMKTNNKSWQHNHENKQHDHVIKQQNHDSTT